MRVLIFIRVTFLPSCAAVFCSTLPSALLLLTRGQGARGVSSLEEKAAVRAAAYAEEGLVRLRVVDRHNSPLYCKRCCAAYGRGQTYNMHGR